MNENFPFSPSWGFDIHLGIGEHALLVHSISGKSWPAPLRTSMATRRSSATQIGSSKNFESLFVKSIWVSTSAKPKGSFASELTVVWLFQVGWNIMICPGPIWFAPTCYLKRYLGMAAFICSNQHGILFQQSECWVMSHQRNLEKGRLVWSKPDISVATFAFRPIKGILYVFFLGLNSWDSHPSPKTFFFG